MEKESMQAVKKEKKLKEFREYLADNGVVLALVKFILELKKNPPTNITASELVQNYFGDYRDPMWDEVEDLQNQIELSKTSAQEKESQVALLNQKILKAKREDEVKALFGLLDPEKSGTLSTRQFVQKMSGVGRFEVDFKMTQETFMQFIIDHLLGEDIENKWEEHFLPMKQIGVGEDGKPKPPPFAGKLEEEPWLHIVEKIKSFSPPK